VDSEWLVTEFVVDSGWGLPVWVFKNGFGMIGSDAAGTVMVGYQGSADCSTSVSRSESKGMREDVSCERR